MKKIKQEQKTREPQYNSQIEFKNKNGLSTLGVCTNLDWHEDPKRLSFVLSRYKFVSKMLIGKKEVLEVGCGDAFGTRIVLDEVDSIDAIDFDPLFIEDAKLRMNEQWGFNCFVHDVVSSKFQKQYDAAYALDVLEHIDPKNERKFLDNIVTSLIENGVLILGMPSLQSQRYASEASKAGHVNCKDEPELRSLLKEYFSNVFIFSMNDEVIHTGYFMMAHYYFALCVNPIRGY